MAGASLHRGIEAERKCVKELKERGYHATRSAASKGEYDVIGIGKCDILLIQVKRTKEWSRRSVPRDKKKLAAATAPINKIVKKELWVWVDRYGWVVTKVVGK